MGMRRPFSGSSDSEKIAQILEVSVDELLSGEELKKSIERDPVLSAPVSNMIQTILYAVA